MAQGMTASGGVHLVGTGSIRKTHFLVAAQRATRRDLFTVGPGITAVVETD